MQRRVGSVQWSKGRVIVQKVGLARNAKHVTAVAEITGHA